VSFQVFYAVGNNGDEETFWSKS